MTARDEATVAQIKRDTCNKLARIFADIGMDKAAKLTHALRDILPPVDPVGTPDKHESARTAIDDARRWCIHGAELDEATALLPDATPSEAAWGSHVVVVPRAALDAMREELQDVRDDLQCGTNQLVLLREDHENLRKNFAACRDALASAQAELRDVKRVETWVREDPRNTVVCTGPERTWNAWAPPWPRDVIAPTLAALGRTLTEGNDA